MHMKGSETESEIIQVYTFKKLYFKIAVSSEGD